MQWVAYWGEGNRNSLSTPRYSPVELPFSLNEFFCVGFTSARAGTGNAPYRLEPTAEVEQL